MEEEYLGDGLYAAYDGYSYWLRAPREDGSDYVALEPLVFNNFMKYVERTQKEARLQRERAAEAEVETGDGA